MLYVLSQVAIFTAVRSGDVKEVKKALANGARVNARDETVSPVSQTPNRPDKGAVVVHAVILPCSRAHTMNTAGSCRGARSSGSCYKALNTRQHNSCSIAVQGRTALIWACQSSVAVVKLLKSHGADLEKSSSTSVSLYFLTT